MSDKNNQKISNGLKILLSSEGKFFYENWQDIFNIPIKDVNLAFISTAHKGTESREYIDKHFKKLEKLGFNFTEIDLDGNSQKELEEIFKDFNFIYVAGGNPFYLLKSIRESGFDKVIKKLISQGVVYIGSSAGAYVACPNIDVSIWKDEYRKKERNRYGVKDLSAMNLVNFLVIAHYEEGLREIIERKLPNLKYPLRILKDGQALLIKDNKIIFFGEEKEKRK
jgi:dipeptidase E